MRFSRVGPAFAALFLATPLIARAQQPPPKFDEYVRRVMQTFTVPGLSVAIVKDGQVVLARGYGVRRMGEAAPVDARTRFGIASNTKLFTATALALLVEEGKIEWDKPVIDYLPAFAMSDPYVTREIAVRDLLVHRSGLGLGAGDLLWWPPSTYNRKEIARRIRYIPLATSFRSAYAYDNVLYLVAGEVIEAVSGKSWEDFVRTRILQKVGMSDSDVRHSGAAEGGNVAGTHAEVNDTVRPVDPFASDNTNPAGGIMSGAADMAKWTATREIIKTVEVGSAPNAFAVHPDGRMMYVSAFFGGTVSEIDMITETVLRTFFVGGVPQDMAVNKKGNRLYVANEIGVLNEVDLLTGASAPDIPLKGGGFGLGVTPDDGEAYVAEPGNGLVEVFGLQTRKLTRTINVGGEPRRVAFSQQGKIGAISNMAGYITFVR